MPEDSWLDKFGKYQKATGLMQDYLSGDLQHEMRRRAGEPDFSEARAPTERNIEQFIADMVAHYKSFNPEWSNDFKDALAFMKARLPRFSSQGIIRVVPHEQTLRGSPEFRRGHVPEMTFPGENPFPESFWNQKGISGQLRNQGETFQSLRGIQKEQPESLANSIRMDTQSGPAFRIPVDYSSDVYRAGSGAQRLYGDFIKNFPEYLEAYRKLIGRK